jgi:hypothetical protein
MWRGGLAVLAGLLLNAPAYAGLTMTVNDTLDEVDVNPGDGVCSTEAGTCTLRAAVMEANATIEAGADEIRLPAGTYQLTIPVPADAEVSKDAHGSLRLGYYQPLVLSGAGPDSTIIEQTTEDRVILVPLGEQVTIRGVTITGGRALSLLPGEALADYGGGIASFGGLLTLQNVVITGNEAVGPGGGLFVKGGLHAWRTRIVENRSQTHGGGVAVGSFQFSYPFDVTETTISGNRAPLGGGIFYWGRARNFHLSQSLVSANVAEGLRLEDGSLASSGRGGGIEFYMINEPWDESTPGLVETTTVRGNEATDGGGIYQYGFDPMRIERSLVAGNTANDGGGIMVRGPLTVQNTTFSGNDADLGGGITLRRLKLTDGRVQARTSIFTRHVDVVGNTARTGSGLFSNGERNGVFAIATIFANEPATNCTLAASRAAGSGGYNIDSGTSCRLSHPTDQSATDPTLDALADNGGPTLTHARLPGSPALDAYSGGGCPTFDQRQGLRPYGGGCDIGAVEQDAPLFRVFLPPAADLREALGGFTHFNIDPAFTQALMAEGIVLEPIEPGRGQSGAASLPVSGGYLGVRWAQLSTRGGITLRRGKRVARLLGLSLSLEDGTGFVSARRGSGRPGRRSYVAFAAEQAFWQGSQGQATLTLTRRAARELNLRLRTRLFKPGMLVGELLVEAELPEPGQEPPPNQDPLDPPGQSVQKDPPEIQ